MAITTYKALQIQLALGFDMVSCWAETKRMRSAGADTPALRRKGNCDALVLCV